MSVLCDTAGARSELDEWTVQMDPEMPGSDMGRTCWESRTIFLAEGMSPAQVRSTLVHEMAHVERGPVVEVDRQAEEEIVCRLAATRLIPIDALISAARAALSVEDVASRLCVDVDTVFARLRTLDKRQVAMLTRSIGDSSGLNDRGVR